MQKTYFPGLNTLRLFAALSVVLGHAIDNLKPLDSGVNPKFYVNFFIMSGYDAVSLFFVLSGFLITYFLLAEQRQSHNISRKNFFIRRTLRIWPLYFLVIAITVFIYPPTTLPSPTTYLALFIFSPHVVEPQYLSGFGHFWSIGVEEWFYLTWPFLVKRFNLIHLILAVILIRLLLISVLAPQILVLGDRYTDWLPRFLHETRFDAMAIGALGAYLLFFEHWTLRIIYRMQLLFIATFIVLVALPLEGGMLFDLIFEFIFMGLILNVSTNPRSILKLENPVFRRLGQVTYGIYMYQLLTTRAASALVTASGLNDLAADVLFLSLTVTLTIVVALISYQYFELPFLRLKPSSGRKTNPSAPLKATEST